MTQSDDRIIGIDIAKIVAMLLVVAVHINGFGLPYVGNNPPGLFYLLLRSFLGAIFMACIDIFAIASGFVGIASSFKISRIVRLWIQVVFTGLAVLACLDFFTEIDVQIKEYLKACIPIAKEEYWYMTAYFMLCFIMPVLNAGIKSLAQNELRNIVLFLLGVVCVESFVCSVGALGVEGGYSFEWLLVLYMVGAYIRLYDPLNKPKWALLGSACVCAMIAGWMPQVVQKCTFITGVHIPRLFEFGGYTSPFTVIIAFCIFVFCLKVRIDSERTRRIVGLLSSTTLGVYLIHVQPVFFRDVFGKYVHKVTVFDGRGYLCSLIILTCGVYAVCTMLDFLRILLFRSIGGFLFNRRR